jgi:hypothetical protein
MPVAGVRESGLITSNSDMNPAGGVSGTCSQLGAGHGVCCALDASLGCPDERS